MSELKPCPFCGGKANFRRRDTYIDTPFMYTWFSIFCNDCEAQTKEYAKIEKAEEAWNRRTEPKHGYWSENHICSNCGGEAYVLITNVRPEYDYDWNENLVPTGGVEFDRHWYETDYCQSCGARMDEVNE